MSESRNEHRAQRVRAAFAAAAAALFLAALAPAVFDSLGEATGAGVIRAAFAPLCHQIPERSFALAGRSETYRFGQAGTATPRAGTARSALKQAAAPTLRVRTLAVCQRCSGIYAGLLLGALAAWFAITPRVATAHARRRRIAIAASTLPMLLDVALELAGVRHGTPLVRAATGAGFGFILSTIVSEGLAELAREGARTARPSIDHARLRT